MIALKAMKIWPAWQHFEENDKGSIEVGKLADFVILSGDPTAVDPKTLAGLKVLVTVKEDKVVYDAKKDDRRSSLSPSMPFGDSEAAHRFMHAMHEGFSGIEP